VYGNATNGVAQKTNPTATTTGVYVTY
jgi:hypothetical protein